MIIILMINTKTRSTDDDDNNDDGDGSDNPSASEVCARAAAGACAYAPDHQHGRGRGARKERGAGAVLHRYQMLLNRLQQGCLEPQLRTRLSAVQPPSLSRSPFPLPPLGRFPVRFVQAGVHVCLCVCACARVCFCGRESGWFAAGRLLMLACSLSRLLRASAPPTTRRCTTRSATSSSSSMVRDSRAPKGRRVRACGCARTHTR